MLAQRSCGGAQRARHSRVFQRILDGASSKRRLNRSSCRCNLNLLAVAQRTTFEETFELALSVPLLV